MPTAEPPRAAAPVREADRDARTAAGTGNAGVAVSGAVAVTEAATAGVARTAGAARGAGVTGNVGAAVTGAVAVTGSATAGVARTAGAARGAGVTGNVGAAVTGAVAVTGVAAAGVARTAGAARTRRAADGGRGPAGGPADRPGRRVGVAVVTGLVVVAAVLLSAGPAQATGYRYWSYWLRSGGAWTYAQAGPAMHIPRDGDVEGWRFGVSQDAAVRGEQPRGTADFATICGATPAAHGTKRIALVIDPGTSADAPGGTTPPAEHTACARIGTDASSADALAAVARPLRYDSAGILCAISGYPQAGCGEQVASSAGSGTSSSGSAATSSPAAPSSASGRKGGGPSLGIYAGLAAVLALAAAAAWQTRRRRR